MEPIPELAYTRKTTYYPQVTHEVNLPAGWSCPFAGGCMSKAERDTGRLTVKGDAFVCYAARAERFPSVRDVRWANYDSARRILSTDHLFNVPKRATHVRVHGSGDFFNAAYFRRWCDTAAAHPNVRFWAFTKSIAYWLDNRDAVPANFTLTASTESRQDALAAAHGLKTATVYQRVEDVPAELPIDTDDTWAMSGPWSFALLENTKLRGAGVMERIAEHTTRARHIIGA